MLEENKNNRYRIYDLNNNLLVDDIIVSFKKRELMNPLNGQGYLISFDDKHFFNMEAKGLVYEKIEDEENSFKRIEFDINKFHKYKMDMWHKICFDKELIDDTVVIYRENDINELDPEVKDLVDVLNKLPFVFTISSCSGHYTKPAFVTMKITNIGILEILSYIIYKYFNDSFYFTTKPGYLERGLGCGFSVSLETYEKGKKIYAKIDELKEKLEKYIKEDLDEDYKKIIKSKYNINIEFYDTDIIKKEILKLKETFNKIKSVYVDCEKKEDKISNQISLIFYEKSAIDNILTILWEDFRNDFVLRTNSYVKYINIDTNNNGICLTLEFIMLKNKIVDKIKALNEALLNKITEWK